MIVTILSAVATSIGLAQACALFDQTRKLRRAGSADEVSVAFLTASLVGNVVWFAYGAFQVDAALLAVNSAGLLGGAATLTTALRLRRRRPAVAAAKAPALGSRSVHETKQPVGSTVVRRNVPKPRRTQEVAVHQRQNCRMAPARIPAASARTASARAASERSHSARSHSVRPEPTPAQPARTAAVPATPIPAEAQAPVLATPHTHRWMRHMCTPVAAAVPA
ncbi:hypothetical protein [Actinopolymorpha rutila]|uniref:MtN3 and saliva related transmembrane protein n=1 Tax=Actinopolymorpha rutila TaxID=446787 RepID=A0A852ZT45_9ACTN|nr:hypothetical protein [Actinopolymorpha rutila]NYH92170.1 hypothetical protein [Actinopolymorpha rutila]